MRPRFHWSAVAAATHYQIQVDDSCSAPASCAFPSPEIDATTTATELEPDAPLGVSFSPPVGRRYFWRVRACTDAVCGPWSAIWYANVGRQRQDFNGDGYGDLVVATGSFFQVGSEDVYFGGSSGTLPTAPSWTVAGDHMTPVGSPPLWPGDLDGDGFPDLVFLAGLGNQGAILQIYAGGGTPATVPAVEIADIDGIWSPRWISDLNGDGFDDLAFSRSSTAPADEVLLGGSPLGAGLGREILLPVPSGELDLFGIGDIDHDGNADIIWGLSGTQSTTLSTLSWTGTGIAERPIAPPQGVDGMTFAGYAGDPLGHGAPTAVFSAGGVRMRVASLVEPPDAEVARCDADLAANPGPEWPENPVAALGDIDGDGQDDFAVGYPLANEVRLYFGACRFSRLLDLSGPPPDPSATVPAMRNGDIVASPGDMDGDGFPELAVSRRWVGIDAAGGQVYVYRGGPSLGTAPATILPSASLSPEGFAAGLD